MDWGNAIIRSKTVDATGQVTAIEMDLNLDGDFRKTQKKITWLAAPTSVHPLIPVTLLDYDYLITKKKLEEDDNVADFVTPVTEFREVAFADANVCDLKKGDILQFERKGYFVFDGEVDGVKEFILIPDGKAANIASKAGSSTLAAADITKASEIPSSSSTMYSMEKIYGDDITIDTATKMYKVDSVYESS
jgi:glutamyl-tRNA synthetase